MQAKIRLRKTSLVDYPGRVAAVFFFQGCNLRCPWCYNRELVLGEAEDTISIEDGLAHIRKRKSVLGGVVLSGGEPCLYSNLPELIEEIKKNELPVKLDTNGMVPAMLEKLFRIEKHRPDYIALDLKIAPERYSELLPPSSNIDPAERLCQSARLIRESGIKGEYRSIQLPGGCFSEKDIEALTPLTGGDDFPWHFRPFIGENCLDPAWNGQ